MSFNVKVETCPKCGCKNTENLLRVEKGSPIKVYVKCSECGTFVACYTLERYTSDKTYESLLRLMRKRGHSVHSRFRAKEIDGFSAEIQEQFRKTLEAPRCELKIEEMILNHR